MMQSLIIDSNQLKAEDLDIRAGSGQNTACHIAAAKTNYNVLFELEKWGADVFVRNKECKTVFQVVNNNLLMLKIVKKIERKQYISKMLN